MSASCSRCDFCKPSPREYVDYECRRMPPIMVEHRSSCSKWFGVGWPEVKLSDWCGEFRDTPERVLSAPEDQP